MEGRKLIFVRRNKTVKTSDIIKHNNYNIKTKKQLINDGHSIGIRPLDISNRHFKLLNL
jgi:hypothetical protein